MYRVLAVAAVAMLLFVMWASHQATIGSNNIFIQLVSVLPYGDKVSHFVLFGLLSLVAIGATRFRGIRFFGFKLYWAVFVVSVYAVADELLQYYSPRRTLDGYDVVFGLLGVVSAQWAGVVVEKYLANR